MKRSIIFYLLILSIKSYSQISLDFQTPACFLFPIKLNNSETKYFENDLLKINSTNQFSLYNLDGSIYKTIQMPPKPDTTARYLAIAYISKSLFDNDTSNIEYLAYYIMDSISSAGIYYDKYQVSVVREDGTILLNEVNASILYSFFDFSGVYSSEIGTKLILNYQYGNGINYQTKVFSLPGKLPNAVKDEKGDTKGNFTIYPNPNNGSFIIDLHSTEGDAITVDLYTDYGKFIDTYISKGTPIRVNNLGLSDGLYLLNTHSKGTTSTTKMIIKK
jgi:hypothetical protein